MERFIKSINVFGYDISSYVIVTEEGITVSVFGGERPHIGAVSIVDPRGEQSDTQFPSHKEGIVTSKWAGSLNEAGFCPVVVEAGIHYDNMSKDQIAQILSATDQLLECVIDQLKNILCF